MAKKQQTDIPESKIRSVIWMLKKKKTKKACCEHLGIPYNTKRLDTIVKDFQDKEQRTKELKAKAAKAELSEVAKKSMVDSYLAGESMAKIGERHYISGPRVKKVLIEKCEGPKKNQLNQYWLKNMVIKKIIVEKYIS